MNIQSTLTLVLTECFHQCAHVCLQACADAPANECAYVYACAASCVCVCRRGCMFACMCKLLQMYAHMYAHMGLFQFGCCNICAASNLHWVARKALGWFFMDVFTYIWTHFPCYCVQSYCQIGRINKDLNQRGNQWKLACWQPANRF